jgi:hypothetical protein
MGLAQTLVLAEANDRAIIIVRHARSTYRPTLILENATNTSIQSLLNPIIITLEERHDLTSRKE